MLLPLKKKNQNEVLQLSDLEVVGLKINISGSNLSPDSRSWIMLYLWTVKEMRSLSPRPAKFIPCNPRRSIFLIVVKLK